MMALPRSMFNAMAGENHWYFGTKAAVTSPGSEHVATQAALFLLRQPAQLFLRHFRRLEIDPAAITNPTALWRLAQRRRSIPLARRAEHLTGLILIHNGLR